MLPNPLFAEAKNHNFGKKLLLFELVNGRTPLSRFSVRVFVFDWCYFVAITSSCSFIDG